MIKHTWYIYLNKHFDQYQENCMKYT